MQESLRLSRGSWEPTAAVFFVFWGQETCKKLVNVTRKWKRLCKGIWYTCNIWLFYVVQYFQFRYLKWPMRTVYFWWDVNLPIERCSEGLVYFILLTWFFRKSFRGAFATTLPAFARWTFDRTAFAEFFAVFGIKTTCDTCIYHIILFNILNNIFLTKKYYIYIILYYIILYYIILYYILYYTILYHIISYYIILYYIILYYIILYITLYYIILYHIILYHIIWYYIIYIILYYIILHYIIILYYIKLYYIIFYITLYYIILYHIILYYIIYDQWYDILLLKIGQSSTFAKLSRQCLSMRSSPSFRPAFASWCLAFAGASQFKPKQSPLRTVIIKGFERCSIVGGLRLPRHTSNIIQEICLLPGVFRKRLAINSTSSYNGYNRNLSDPSQN